MKFRIAGAAAGLQAVSLGFMVPAFAQDHAPVEGQAPVDGPAPHGGDAPADETGHGAAGNTEAVEHNEGGAFPPFNSETFASQLVWLAIIFGLFYLFLKRTVLPQVGSILETRRARIAEDLSQANRMKADADAAVAAYEQALAEARSRAGTIAQEARDAAKADAEAERKRVEQGLDEKLAEAQTHIESVKASAMSEVGAIAAETAEAIVTTLTGRDVDRAAVDAAVSAARS